MKLLFLALTFLGLACTHTPAIGQSKLKPAAFEAMLKKDPTVQLVDVRTPEEYEQGYIGNAKNLNLYDADFVQNIEQLDKNRPVMVYCAKGARSASAADQFSKQGFTKVYDLEGGITAWIQAKKPVTH